MSKIFFITALILISLTGKLFAQNYDRSRYENDNINGSERPALQTTTEFTFSMAKYFVNIRDFVHLRDASMMLELNNVNDFDRLKSLDSILIVFRKEISFYKDSFEKYPGSVTVDYVMHDDHDYREIRFTKHKPDGDIYVSKDGEVSRLKTERDTIRIIIHMKGEELHFEPGKTSLTLPTVKAPYTIQVALFLNNISDIDKVIADKEMLRHSIDTLQSTQSRNTVSNPFRYPSSAIYRPYSEHWGHFVKYNSILKDESGAPWALSNRTNKLTLGLNMGAGLIRNTITPMGEIGLNYINHRAYRNDDYFTFMSLTMTPYFFFDRSADGQFFIKDNWFANFEIGSPGDLQGLKTKLLTMGVGYLVVENGNYFKGTTMKAFLNIKLKAAFTVSPELIFTNNFKQIFPGITLKIF